MRELRALLSSPLGLAAGVLLLVLSGCSGGTAEDHYARAQAHAERGDDSAAVIELKNALQKDPDFAPGRLLLGQLYSEAGDFTAALRQFQRAFELGLEDDALRPGLLSTKVELGRSQEVIGELEQEPRLGPALTVVLADAYAAAGDLEKARMRYEKVLEMPGAKLGLGLLSWREGDAEGALDYIDAALAQAPDDLDLLLAKAELELNLRNLEAAAAAFSRAASLPHGAAVGGTGLARVELIDGDLESAASNVDLVLAETPDFTPARYLRGLIRYQMGQFEEAAAAVRKVLDTLPGHLPSRYLLGAIDYRRGDVAAAQKHLEGYLEQKPDDESAAKLLASIYADEGEFESVQRLLEPLQRDTSDPQILAMYGSAQMRLGDQADATAALERAVSLAPDMAPFRNQLALSLLSAGDTARAESELRTAIDVDGGQFQSDYLLALLRLREQDWDGALSAAAGLVSKNPESPVGFNIRGAAYLGKGDDDAAERSFRLALERAPSFFPAVENLSKLAEREGDFTTAESYYQEVLRDTPEHPGALLAIADLSIRQGREEDAMAFLERAVAADPRSVPASLGLARLQLARGRTAEAAATVDQALAGAPGQLDLRLLRADIALRAGDMGTARRIASDLQSDADRLADNAALRKSLGLLQANAGQLTLARINLENALKLGDRQDAEVLRALIRLDVRDRNLAEARRRLDQLARSGVEGPNLDLLKAEVMAAGGDERGAQAIYQRLADRGVREAVMQLASFRLETGQLPAAIGLLEAWVAENPDDRGSQMLLAEALIRSGESERAIDLYEQLARPGSPLALNNLAWLYLQKGDERAERTARDALAAAPDNPDILDTLGWILQQKGEAEEAVTLLRRSAELKPGDPTVAFHLGLALRDNGDVEGARRSLQKALDAGPFAEAALAQEVLNGLAGSRS